jgi:DnaJ-class molecular chaperone
MRRLIPDPYEVLGITRDATQREVKQAYRKLAKKFHPDHNPEKPETAAHFKQIQQAYETLTGRSKQGRSWTAVFYHSNYPSSFSVDEHPFVSFFGVLKNYSAGIKKNKNSSESSNLDRANDETE